MDKEKRKEIEMFVIEFMNEHYFKIDENNQSLYTSQSGHHEVNMKAMFETILEDYIEEQSSDAVQLLDEIDDLLIKLEDYTHGQDGLEITQIRHKIDKFKNQNK